MPVSGDWTYTESGGNATITAYSGSAVCVIPEELDTYPVTGIAANALESDSLTSVTINHTIDLGEECFRNNSGLDVYLNAEVTTDNVDSTEQGPFEGCSIGDGLYISATPTTIPQRLFCYAGLTSVAIPDNITTIGGRSFYQNSITSVTIPSSVTVIDDYAFKFNNIASIELNGAVDLGDNAFGNNSGIDVYLNANVTTTRVTNEDYGPFESCSIGDGLYISATPTSIPTYLFAYSGLTSVDMPDNITSIGSYAFYNNSIASLSLSSGLTSTGTSAFRYNSLTSLDIPSSITTISTSSFSNNSITSLTIPETLTVIDDYAFNNNDFTSITFDYSVDLGSNVFGSSTGIEVYLNANVTTTRVTNENYGPFENCAIGNGLYISATPTSIPTYLFAISGLTSIDIPENITSIGSYAFYNNSLTSVEIPSSITTLNPSTFSSNSITSLTIPETLTVIDDYAFNNNDFTSITFDYPVDLGSNAFGSSTGIEVTLNANITTTRVTNENYGPFENCAIADGLTITSNVTSIPNYLFARSGITEIAFLSSVTSVGTYCMYDNDDLSSITVRNTSTTFGSSVLSGSEPSPKGVIYGETGSTAETLATTYSTYYDFSEHIWTYTESGGNATITGYNGASDCVIPETIDGYPVTGIAVDALQSESLTSVTINHTINLNDGCFRNNTGLEVYLNAEVTTNGVGINDNPPFDSCAIGDGLYISATPTTIPDYLFRDSGLTSVNIPDGITLIGVSAFSDNSLTSLTIPESVTTIDNYAFYINSIASIEFNHDIDLDPGCFANNSGIEVYLNANVTTTSIGKYDAPPFDNCTIGDGLYISATPTTIPDYLFRDSGLTSVNIPDGITLIGEYAFSDNSLTSLTIPESVTTIDNYAFYINSIASIEFNHDIDLDPGCFANNSGIDVYLNASLITTGSIGKYDDPPFANCAIGTGLYISATPTSISNYLFRDAGLTSVDIPENITLIGEYTFEGNAIASLELNYPVELDRLCFQGNTGMDVYLNANVTTDNITSSDYAAFYSCSIGDGVTIGTSPTSIPPRLFSNSGISSITFPSNITSVGIYAMYNNSDLSSITVWNNATTFGTGVLLDCEPSPKGVIYGETGSTAETLATTYSTYYDFSEHIWTYTESGGNATLTGYSGDSDCVIPETIAGYPVTGIAVDALQSESLTSVTINHTIDLNDGCFRNNTGIEVYLNANVTTSSITQYDNPPFDSCAIGSGLYISATLTTISNYLFRDAGLTSVDIPDNITSIGIGAFRDNSLTSLTIPESVTTISDYAFKNNSIASIEFNHDIDLDDGCFSNNTGIDVYLNASVTTGSVSKYDEPPFDSCAIGSGLYISATPTTIPNYLFRDAGLTSIDIPDNITLIGVFAFRDNSLTSLTIPESVTTINDYAFKNNSIASIEFNHDIDLDDGCFANNTGIEVYLNANVTTTSISQFDDPPFADCSIGSGLTIGATPTTIPNYLFRSAGLTSVTINHPVDLGLECFRYNLGLDVYLNANVTADNITSSSDAPFYSCTIGDGLYISATPTTIPYPLFAYAGITSLDIPDNITTIGRYSFRDNSITSVDIPEGVVTVDDGVFYNNSITSLTLPSSVTSIGEYAFYNNSIASLELNYPVDLDVLCFQGNTGIDVYLNANVTTDNITSSDYAPFHSCSIGDGFTIGTSPTSIPPRLFSFSGISSIAFPSNITSVGIYAMYNNSDLSSITVWNNATTFGTGVLLDCEPSPKGVIYGETGSTAETLATTYSTYYDFSEHIWTYTESGGNATLTGYSGDSDCVIPETIAGYPVVAIAANALENESLTSVTINHTIDLGEECFKSNSGLDVYLNAEVTTDNVSNSSLAPFHSCAIGDGLYISATPTTIPYPLFAYAGITSLDIPDNITTIGRYSFRSNSITSLDIPEGVVTVDDVAFYDNSIASLTLPSSVTSIGEYCFQNNSIASLELNYPVDLDVGCFADNTGIDVYLNANVTTGNVGSLSDPPFDSCAIGSGLTIGATPTIIHDYLFRDSGLTNVDIPDGIILIGNSAFRYNSITSLTIPESVTTIYPYAFKDNSIASIEFNYPVNLYDGCFESNTGIDVYLNANVTTSGVSQYDDPPFEDCAIGTGLYISATPTSIPAYLFRDSGLTSVDIPDSITSIGISAFRYNSITSLTIPESITTIDDYVFMDNSIASIEFNHDIDLDPGCFANNTGIEVYLNANVTTGSVGSLSDPPFEDCAIGTGLYISATPTTIPAYLFRNSGLTSVTINHPVDLDENCFKYNLGIDVYLNANVTTDNISSSTYAPFHSCSIGDGFTIGTSPTSIPPRLFSYSGISSIAFSSNITSVGIYAMYENDDLSSITVRNNATTFGTGVLNGSEPSPKGVIYGETGSTAETLATTYSTYYNFSELEWTYTESGGNATITGYNGASDCVIPETIDGYPVVAIAEDALASESLTSVTFNHTVDLEYNCFYGNSGIDIYLNANLTTNNILISGDGPFEDCSIGSGVYISSTPTSIPNYLFNGCGLTSIDIPENITSIGTYAFRSNGLTSVDIPSGITTISTHAFSSNSITSLIIPETVTTIGDYAFYDNSITSVTFDYPVDLGDNCFRDNTGIDVYLNANVTTGGVSSVTSAPFEDCSIGSGLYISATPTTIPYPLFAYAGITSLDIPNNITSIGIYAFYVNNLTSLTIPSSVTVIDDYAFMYNNIASISFDSVVDLGSNAFANNTGIEVTLNADITTTRVNDETYGPFESCSLADGVTITSNVTSIPNYLFAQSGITEIAFTSSVTSVGTYCMYDNDNLSSITVINNATTFGSGVLDGCEPSPKGVIYGETGSTAETLATTYSTYYNFSALVDVTISPSTGTVTFSGKDTTVDTGVIVSSDDGEGLDLFLFLDIL